MGKIRFFLTLLILAIPAVLLGQLGIRVSIGPPMLPVYEQPLCPGDGYLWTPGYWAYNESVSDYYWVPGTWVQAPEVGFLWTPGYWGWRENGYFFNEGYWGQTVGFYGGVHYGYGYYGDGYRGGRWENGHFFYNRSESHVDEVSFHNVYNERVEHGSEVRVSFNGGNGGIDVRANPEQERAARERHIAPVAVQTEHIRSARETPELRASANHGNPTIGATSRPGEFGSRAAGRTPAEGSKMGNADAAHPSVHPRDLPPIARPAPANSGNVARDKQYEQKQDQLIARQTQERQHLQQKQDVEHQRTVNANAQNLEQRHQQQTQQLSQKHVAQQQKLQTRQPQARPEKQQSHPNEKP
jgi:WXXGXW repeat (2 copies)